MAIMFCSTGFSLSLEILFPLLPALHWQNVMGEYEGVKREFYSRGELSAHTRPLKVATNGTTDVFSRKSLHETEFSSSGNRPLPHTESSYPIPTPEVAAISVKKNSFSLRLLLSNRTHIVVTRQSPDKIRINFAISADYT